MLTAAPRKAPSKRDADGPSGERDPSAEFIQDLAQSGTANELGTVKAASDAVEGEAESNGRKARRPDKQTD